MKKRIFLTLFIALAVSGCTSLVKISPYAEQTRIMTAKTASNCTVLGKTTVSVLAKILFFERDKKTILGELEILARNSATKMQGDTASPDDEPVDGEQTYTVYRCFYGGH